MMKNISMLILIFSVLILKADKKYTVNTENVAAAEKIAGLEFTSEERDSLLTEANENLEAFITNRAAGLSNSVPPSLQFNPVPVNFQYPEYKPGLLLQPVERTELPENREDLAFYSVRELANLIKTGRISSLELTKFFLDRLKKYDNRLNCVITYTDKTALAEAAKADAEIKSGKYRGLLHGIPYGAKDLLAVKGYPTTWGANPFREQHLDEEATVVKKLRSAGAVLIAKLSLGALAWGDVWFGGKTRNPWNTEQGSSGSSAGSAAATAAGLVPFAIGSETWGSIVSPSTRCGTTGLRPTYGRVSRAGAMALSWSMDKIGPICRTVEDCAVVFDAIHGPDGIDQTVVDVPFRFGTVFDPALVRVGYTKSLFEEDYANRANDAATLKKLEEIGIELFPVELPDVPVRSLSFILGAEAAAAFDDLTRSNRDDLLVRQIKNAWPNVLRASRLIPAVEYIQANRLRYQLVQEMHKLMRKIDVYVVPSFGGDNLLMTNLTGHPSVVLPNGFNKKGSPASISFVGSLFDEGILLAVANLYQRNTDYHKQHPPAFK